MTASEIKSEIAYYEYLFNKDGITEAEYLNKVRILNETLTSIENVPEQGTLF